MKCERCKVEIINADDIKRVILPCIDTRTDDNSIVRELCNQCFFELANNIFYWMKRKIKPDKEEIYIFEEARDEVIIQSIQDVRSDNNKAWMDLLRLAFKSNPEQAKKIFSHITENDRKINELSRELCE